MYVILLRIMHEVSVSLFAVDIHIAAYLVLKHSMAAEGSQEDVM